MCIDSSITVHSSSLRLRPCLLSARLAQVHHGYHSKNNVHIVSPQSKTDSQLLFKLTHIRANSSQKERTKLQSTTWNRSPSKDSPHSSRREMPRLTDLIDLRTLFLLLSDASSLSIPSHLSFNGHLTITYFPSKLRTRSTPGVPLSLSLVLHQSTYLF